MSTFKLGRSPRAFNPRVPHMSALIGKKVSAPPPVVVDYTTVLPANLGVMLNDQQGDCTCAGIYHAKQVWTANANPPIQEELDSNVESVYEGACGYVPGNPSTDNGGVEQEVLAYWMKTGVPTVSGVDNLLAFLEVDHRSTDDVKWAISDCGLVYIGIDVPAYLMDSVPDVWDVNPAADNSIIGGHCIILPGYNSIGPKLISWGQVYQMTWAFFAQFTDEVYALADRSWITVKGTTPGGLSITQLEQQMQALRGN